MSGEEHPIDVGWPALVVPGEAPSGDAEWTTVRCGGCGRPGRVPTASLPLLPGLDPVRDADGVRLGACPRCRAGNRAQRRRRK